MAHGKKVTVVGCGNWGTAAAKTISENTLKFDLFDDTVRMWVLEEKVDGVNLSELINTQHENKKYLPGVKLPENLLAVPDLNECVKDTDLFVFVIPHQFVKSTAEKMKASGFVKNDALAISLVKGIMILENKPVLVSDVVERELGVPCSALSGANVANCIAKEEFSEATIAYTTKEHALLWQRLFDRPYFKIRCIKDVAGIQVYGAIKNVVALSAGFCDSLGLGSNTKAAVMRIGLCEIHKFAKEFFPSVSEEVVLESAGVADLITTCIGGRNVRCAAEFAAKKGARPWNEIEQEFLNGQKLQGVSTCHEVYEVLKDAGKLDEFPLFHVTYRIAFESADPQQLIDSLSNLIEKEHTRGESTYENYIERIQQLELFSNYIVNSRKKDIPNYLCCKISMCLMRDPVITPSGHTYERKLIETHILLNGEYDPFTRESCKIEDLLPNFTIKEAVESFLEKNPWAYDDYYTP